MKKSIAIIGGGPAGMALAAFLDNQKYQVTLYEKNKALGRKFLVAGKGGFNLTHSLPMAKLKQKYAPVHFLSESLDLFTNESLRKWLLSLGIPTFIGSSGRVFPEKGIKPIEVLRAIVNELERKKVTIEYQKEWTGWDQKGNLVFNHEEVVQSDVQVFALGGGSWKITGSDGKWLEIFAKRGIKTLPFLAANCAFSVTWPFDFINKWEGGPLKNIGISCNNHYIKGEVVVTNFGLEGNAIYGLTRQIQGYLQKEEPAPIFLDLKPVFTNEKIENLLLNSKNTAPTHLLKQDLKLTKIKIQLLKAYTSREEFLNPKLLSKKIKALPIIINKAAPVDEAISTTGGVSLSELDSHYQLYRIPGTFCLGEMVDWYAPTGGFLLQGCFSMGVGLARYLNESN